MQEELDCLKKAVHTMGLTDELMKEFKGELDYIRRVATVDKNITQVPQMETLLEEMEDIVKIANEFVEIAEYNLDAVKNGSALSSSSDLTGKCERAQELLSGLDELKIEFNTLYSQAEQAARVAKAAAEAAAEAATGGGTASFIPSASARASSSISDARSQIEQMRTIGEIRTYITTGLVDFNLPSEYVHFKNKYEWIESLKTSYGRKSLFNSLSAFVQYLSGMIADMRKNDPLRVISPLSSGPDAHRVSDATYHEFEKFVCWHVLDEIMSTVRFQMSLNFGRERPNKPDFDFSSVELYGYAGYAYIRLLIAKVFLVLAISSVLFSYVYDPQHASRNDFAKRMEDSGQATFHEVTFFRGSQHIPLVTFYTPDIAEQYESLGGMHWIDFAAAQGITNIDLEVHKFITPRLTGAFMDFFGDMGGATWTRDESLSHSLPFGSGHDELELV